MKYIVDSMPLLEIRPPDRKAKLEQEALETLKQMTRSVDSPRRYLALEQRLLELGARLAGMEAGDDDVEDPGW